MAQIRPTFKITRQEGRVLEGTVTSQCQCLQGQSIFSEKITIFDVLSLHLQSHMFYIVNTSSYGTSKYHQIISIAIDKMFTFDKNNYTITLSSNGMITKETKISVDSCWQQIGYVTGTSSTCINFNIIIVMNINRDKGYTSRLYDDLELVDFDLCGEDGAVKVHKIVLASCSPVLRRLMAGQWKETSTGTIKVSGTTIKTLEHFKEYIYLKKLPDDVEEIKNLAMLGSYYMMPDLKRDCSFELLSKLRHENIIDLLELALKYKLRLFLLALFNRVHSGKLSVKDIDATWLSAEAKEEKKEEEPEESDDDTGFGLFD